MKLSVKKIAVVLALVMVFTTCEAAFSFSWSDAAKLTKNGASKILSPKVLINAGAALCAGSIWGGIKAYSAEDGKGWDEFKDGFIQGFKAAFRRDIL